MSAIERVLNGFRLFKGELMNQLIDICNNISGNGTPAAVYSSGSVLTLTALTTNGAISPTTPANYVITKAGVLADTLAAPTSDGIVIVITSNTANAHTLTATGLLQCGTAAVNLATFAANAGAGLTLVSYSGKWNVLASVGITFS